MSGTAIELTRAFRNFSRSAAVVLIATLGPSLTPDNIAHAQPAGLAETQPHKLPDPLTKQAIRDYVSRLSDEQARQTLLGRLDAEAESRTRIDAADEPALPEMLTSWSQVLGAFLIDKMTRLQDLPRRVTVSARNFLGARPGHHIATFLALFAAACCAGTGAAWLTARSTISFRKSIAAPDRQRPGARFGAAAASLAVRAANPLVFVLVAATTANVLLGGQAADLAVARLILAAIVAIWLTWEAIRFVLAPGQPNLRLVAVDDATATFLSRRAIVAATILAIGDAVLRWIGEFSPAESETLIPFWTFTIAHVLIGVSIWQARDGLARAMGSQDDGTSAAHVRLARAWPVVAVVFAGVQWLAVEFLIATGHEEGISLTAIYGSLVLFLLVPAFDRLINASAGAACPVASSRDAALRAAQTRTRLALVRAGRIVAGLALVAALLWLWDIDLLLSGPAAPVAGALIQAALLALAAYGAWEAVGVVLDRQLAHDQATLALDPDADADFEGGREGSRVGTLLPLVKWTVQIFIATFAGLAILSALGINTTSLLAGAGIIGIALGFGAQTLVRDIISGLFFLIDDAFRKGEYIDVGSVKGTVEHISIRSLQLRHQNGPLNTIPFGEIKHLTNLSRNWVIMKLPLRLTYDTDIDRVRKLIKKLGQELLDDEQIGGKFLQPLKSQGVIQMDDSAMIVRVKFKTKPGDQWSIRNKVFARIRELFQREGVKFAHREVTVRVEASADRPEQQLSERDLAGAGARIAIDEMAGKKLVPADSR